MAPPGVVRQRLPPAAFRARGCSARRDVSRPSAASGLLQEAHGDSRRANDVGHDLWRARSDRQRGDGPEEAECLAREAGLLQREVQVTQETAEREAAGTVPRIARYRDAIIRPRTELASIALKVVRRAHRPSGGSAEPTRWRPAGVPDLRAHSRQTHKWNDRYNVEDRRRAMTQMTQMTGGCIC